MANNRTGLNVPVTAEEREQFQELSQLTGVKIATMVRNLVKLALRQARRDEAKEARLDAKAGDGG